MEEDKRLTPPRPGDAFTAQDGAYLYALIDRVRKEIEAELSNINARLAVAQKNHIEMLETLNIIETGLSEQRVGRLEIEVKETELELAIAEQRRKAVEEKLALKKDVKDNQIDTNEKIKAAATAAYSDLEKKKKESDEAFFMDLRRSIIKAVLISLAVSGTAGVMAFIYWLFMLYVNRGGT